MMPGRSSHNTEYSSRTSSEGGVALQTMENRHSVKPESDESIKPSIRSDPNKTWYEYDDSVSQGDATSGSEGDAAANNRRNELAQDLETPTMHAAATVSEPPRPVRWWNVSSSIINKMIGAGIYCAPPAVLILTRSKEEALGLWFLGFFYTLISMAIYLQYARKLPHIGGELIYLDEAFPKPTLLVYTVYALLYILFENSATNSMVFASQVYLSATDGDNPDQRVLRLIAVVIITIVCLLHYFSARMGRDLNVILAVSKVSMLVVLCIGGAVKATKEHAHNFNGVKPETPNSPSSFGAGLLLVLFAFQGWENATFMAGEIASFRTLCIGFAVAVLVVGVLYIIVNVVFLIALPYTGQSLQYAAKYFGDTPKARQAWAVLIAISAAGSLVSKVYTTAKVKQAIGRSNILFWSRLWGRDSPFKPATPTGGLILQWIMTVILISASSAIGNLDEAIFFPALVQIYIKGLIGVFVGCGFLFLGRRRFPLPKRRNGKDWTSSYEPKILQSLWIQWSLTIGLVLFNLAILIIPLIPPDQNVNDFPREIHGWYYLVILSAAVFVAIIYYYAVHNPKWSISCLGGVQPQIFTDEEHYDDTYGNRRVVRILPLETPSFYQNFVYWLFGGSDETRHPQLRVSNFFPTRRHQLSDYV